MLLRRPLLAMLALTPATGMRAGSAAVASPLASPEPDRFHGSAADLAARRLASTVASACYHLGEAGAEGMWTGKCLQKANAAFAVAFWRAHVQARQVSMALIRECLCMDSMAAAVEDTSLPRDLRSRVRGALHVVNGYRFGLPEADQCQTARDYHNYARALIMDALAVLPPRHPALRGIAGKWLPQGLALTETGAPYRDAVAMKRWRERVAAADTDVSPG